MLQNKIFDEISEEDDPLTKHLQKLKWSLMTWNNFFSFKKIKVGCVVIVSI